MVTTAIVLSGLVGLAVAANTFIDLWRKLHGTDKDAVPQPMLVKRHDDFVTAREFREYKEHMSRVHAELRQAMKDEFRELKEERAESLRDLHQHIDSSENRIKVDVSEVGERINTGAKSMQELGERVAALEGKRRR